MADEQTSEAPSEGADAQPNEHPDDRRIGEASDDPTAGDGYPDASPDLIALDDALQDEQTTQDDEFVRPGGLLSEDEDGERPEFSEQTAPDDWEAVDYTSPDAAAGEQANDHPYDHGESPHSPTPTPPHEVIEAKAAEVAAETEPKPITRYGTILRKDHHR